LRAFQQAPLEQKAVGVDESLSDREIEVLKLIAAGLTNQEIAERLFISLNTVRTHTKNINSKLDVHSRTQAIARAKKLGLI
jgi:ATP/maltotriose-dependent transcriptional regulator MalT